jgi:hypothetical protein
MAPIDSFTRLLAGASVAGVCRLVDTEPTQVLMKPTRPNGVREVCPRLKGEPRRTEALARRP